MLLFEKSDDPTVMYRRIKTFQVQGNTNAAIITLAVSPTEETLVCGLQNSQLFTLSLSSTDLMNVCLHFC